MTPFPDAFLEGCLVIAYHSSREALVKGQIEPFLHLGTLQQAQSRAGGIITKVTARLDNVGRLVDRGENIWRKDRLQPFLRKGRGWAVYLNRHEAIDLDEMDRALKIDPNIDDATDAKFKRLVPSAHDSLILLDPFLIVSMEESQKR